MSESKQSAKVETLPYITTETVVTVQGEDYYVADIPRAGSYDLIRLSDMKEGFKATTRHNIKPGRPATEEERAKVYKLQMAKFEEQAKYREGAIVRPIKDSKHATTKQLFVVTKINPKTIAVAELGGGLMLNGPMQLWTVVDPADVLK